MDSSHLELWLIPSLRSFPSRWEPRPTRFPKTACRAERACYREIRSLPAWAGSGLYSSTTRKTNGYYWGELLFDNSSAPVYPIVSNIAVLNNPPGPDPVAMETGRVFVARSPEVFRYDADGNLTNDGRWVFTWDNENRLVKVESLTNAPAGSKRKLEFAYDYLGRRIKREVYVFNPATSTYEVLSSLKFLYDGWNLVAELNATNNYLVRSYTWGLDLSESMQGAGGIGGLLKVSYYGAQTTNGFVAYDGNGNVLGLVNSADGTLIAQYEYGPFGELLRATGPMAKANPFRFSTKYQDDETDLIIYPYRPYSASTGRWLSRDPIGEGGGNNLYGFVGNDPANTIDPLGEDFIAVGGLPVPSMPVLGIGVHMSLRFYRASCSDDPHEGVRFSPGSPPNGSQLEDAVQLWTAWRNYRHFFYVRPKPTAPPERTFVFIPISYIERASAATRLLVLYSDADNGRGSSAKGWKQIIGAAAN